MTKVRITGVGGTDYMLCLTDHAALLYHGTPCKPVWKKTDNAGEQGSVDITFEKREEALEFIEYSQGRMIGNFDEPNVLFELASERKHGFLRRLLSRA